MDLQRSLKSLREAIGGTEGPAAISRERAKPAKLLLLGYLSYMVVGWVLLSLPYSQAVPVSALDNLFMAVSAVSTTGLVTIDTGTSYTFTGQLVILVLIQFGGIGYMTASSFVFLAFRNQLSDTRRATARTAYSLPDSISPALFVRAVILFTVGCEALGAACLYVLFAASGEEQPVWSAIFHSVSAFCTAGFSLNTDSFSGYATDVGVNAVICALSILGAVGFIVVADTIRRVTGGARHFGFTSKVILRLTAILLLGGTVLLFLVEPEATKLPPWERALTSFFQAMTASTTVGFNTLDIGALSSASIMVMLVLMLIGASPAGTGGGLKTTSLAVLVALVRSTLKGRDEVRFFKRQVSQAQLQAATTSLACYAGTLVVALFFLFLTEPGVRFDVVVFEAVSAIGTVGLSMGLTGDLSPIGKVIVIALMTIGRLGVLTFGLATAVHDESREEESDNELAL